MLFGKYLKECFQCNNNQLPYATYKRDYVYYHYAAVCRREHVKTQFCSTLVSMCLDPNSMAYGYTRDAMPRESPNLGAHQLFSPTPFSTTNANNESTFRVFYKMWLALDLIIPAATQMPSR